jgi:hypothetical protein
MPTVLLTIIAEYASYQWCLLVRTGVGLRADVRNQITFPQWSIYLLESSVNTPITTVSSEHKNQGSDGDDHCDTLTTTEVNWSDYKWHHLKPLDNKTMFTVLGIIDTHRFLFELASPDANVRLVIYDVTKGLLSSRLSSSAPLLRKERCWLMYRGSHPSLANHYICSESWTEANPSLYIIKIDGLSYSWRRVAFPLRYNRLRLQYQLSCQYEGHVYFFGRRDKETLQVTMYNLAYTGVDNEGGWHTTKYINKAVVPEAYHLVIPGYGILFLSAAPSRTSMTVTMFQPASRAWSQVRWALPEGTSNAPGYPHMAINWWNNTVMIMIITKRYAINGPSTHVITPSLASSSSSSSSSIVVWACYYLPTQSFWRGLHDGVKEDDWLPLCDLPLAAQSVHMISTRI